jgi:hypothetical protein
LSASIEVLFAVEVIESTRECRCRTRSKSNAVSVRSRVPVQPARGKDEMPRKRYVRQDFVSALSSGVNLSAPKPHCNFRIRRSEPSGEPQEEPFCSFCSFVSLPHLEYRTIQDEMQAERCKLFEK